MDHQPIGGPPGEQIKALGLERPDMALPITQEITKTLAGRLRKTNDDMMTLYDALVQELQ